MGRFKAKAAQVWASRVGKLVVLGAVGIGLTTGGAVAATSLPINSVGSAQIQNEGVWGGDIHRNTIAEDKLGWAFRSKVDKAQADATKALEQGGKTGPAGPVGPAGPEGKTGPAGPVGPEGKTGPAGPVGPAGKDGKDGVDGKDAASGLPNWGTIFRNVIGSGTTVLGQSSAGEALNINTTSPADQATFGNEVDFAGKPVNLGVVKYDVFTTGENSAKGNNMPSVKVEITNPVAGATYTTLVYAPENSASNAWTTVNASADTGKNWGFSGAFFNGADKNEKCGMNGARCTLADAIAVLGGDAKVMSVAIGKGRDYEFHGAVRSLTIMGATYNFTAHGVEKAE